VKQFPDKVMECRPHGPSSHPKTVVRCFTKDILCVSQPSAEQAIPTEWLRRPFNGRACPVSLCGEFMSVATSETRSSGPISVSHGRGKSVDELTPLNVKEISVLISSERPSYLAASSRLARLDFSNSASQPISAHVRLTSVFALTASRGDVRPSSRHASHGCIVARNILSLTFIFC
jgi:hypothetical protein